MARSRWSADDGVTLIELLVSLVVLGIAFVAVLAGLATSSASSDRLRGAAAADTVLRSFAEHVKGAPYSSCSHAAAAYAKEYEGFTTVVTVSAWDHRDGSRPCRAPDRGLQLVELTVQTEGGDDSRAAEARLRLVKRDPDQAP